VSVCRCEFDWRRSKPILVEETEVEVSGRVFACFGLTDLQTPVRAEQTDYLRELSLKDLLAVLFFFASQYRAASDQRGKRAHIARFGSSMRNEEIHHFLCKAAHVFHDWPNNYFAFLQWRIENFSTSKDFTGVQKTFGYYWDALYSQFRNSAFDFLRRGLEEFITNNWDGGHISRVFRLSKQTRDNKRFVSKQEARESLRVSSDTIDKWLKTGKLNGIIRKNGRSKIFLIEARCILKLKAQREDLLDTKDSSKRLGLTIKQTKALARAKLLTPRDLHRIRTGIFYSIKEIDDLLSRVISSAKNPGVRRSNGTINFAQAVARLACRNIGVSELVRSILIGKIQPCSVVRICGFAGLTFYQRDIVEYQKDIYRTRYPNTLNALETSKILNTHPDVVRFLVRNNLLASVNEKSPLAIPMPAISSFSAKYVLPLTLAKALHTSARCLIDILRMESINPVTVTKAAKPKFYVYRREDVDKKKLRTLIASRRRMQTSSESLDISGATQFLKTKPETILKLVANGVLRPLRSSTRKGSKSYRFSMDHLRKFTGRVRDCIDLMSVRVAAQLCGVKVKNFNARFGATGRLRVVYFAGRRTPYFHRKDVELFVQRTKALVRSGEVCALLRIGQSQLLRLVDSGELKPVSGPHLDGAPINLFLKSDVEAIRKRRESFKRRRASEGGSQRFGKRAGPTSRPVMEMIAPRVNVWLARAKAKRIRPSGTSIHRRLVHEGYEVGIASVYVYLRSCRI